MEIMPKLDEVERIASTGLYDVLPISTEILSDFTTPIETVKILKNLSGHCYMLESAQANETWGRYTFLGFDPKTEVTCIDGEMHITTGGVKEVEKTDHPSKYLRTLLSKYKSPRFAYLPPFTGGLVGYFSYDYLGYSEPTVRVGVEDTENFKDVDLMLFDKVIAFDNVKQKIILIVNIRLSDIESNYNKAVWELKQLAELLRKGEKKKEAPGKLLDEVTPLFEKEAFCDMVEKSGQIPYELMRPYPSMLFGLETAFWDLKHQALPLQEAFSIPINGLVWMGTFDEMYQRIEDKLEQGFHCVKLKIGAIDWNREIELIRFIRSNFSKEQIELRVDANGGFTPEDAMRKLEQLAAYDIHSIEQPIRRQHCLTPSVHIILS